MDLFSRDKDNSGSIAELVLDSLLSNTINSIIDLNLSFNESWFCHPNSSNVDLLTELITKQVCLQYLNLSQNFFSSNATLKILTKIADLAPISKLQIL